MRKGEMGDESLICLDRFYLRKDQMVTTDSHEILISKLISDLFFDSSIFD